MRISLHHLIVRDGTATELIEIASDLGCAHVCLFLKRAWPAPIAFPSVDSVPSMGRGRH
jgi:hypothetical protein